MFRPQVGHHQANTEHIKGTTKWALSGIQFRFTRTVCSLLAWWWPNCGRNMLP